MARLPLATSISLAIGVVVGALVFGAAGVFFGYSLAAGEPRVIVRNLSRTPISQVRL